MSNRSMKKSKQKMVKKARDEARAALTGQLPARQVGVSKTLAGWVTLVAFGLGVSVGYVLGLTAYDQFPQRRPLVEPDRETMTDEDDDIRDEKGTY